MNLPEALQCMATITLRLQRLRDEGGAKIPDGEGEEGCTHTATHDQNKSYYTSKLHDLLSCHHSAIGKCIYMPVCDIQKFRRLRMLFAMTKSQHSTTAGPHSSFRREERYQSSIPLSLNLDSPAVLSSGRLIYIGYYQSNPKRNDVLRNLILPFSCREEESGALRPELLCSAEISLEGYNGAEQHLIPALIHKISQRWKWTPRTADQTKRGSGSWPQSREGRRRYNTSNPLSDVLGRKGRVTH